MKDNKQTKDVYRVTTTLGYTVWFEDREQAMSYIRQCLSGYFDIRVNKAKIEEMPF